MGLLRNKTRVIIDTNFLLLPGSKGIDIFTEIQANVLESLSLCVVEQSLIELDKLAQGITPAKGKDKFNAKLGFILAKQKGLKTLHSSHPHADDAIVNFVRKGTYVATLDKKLQRRVLAQGGNIITVQQKKLVVRR